MHEPGDILLFALSAWKETGWIAFKKAFDEIYRMRLANEGNRDGEPVRFERARALRTLVTLGHCDVDFAASHSVIVAPTALASLPYPGLPRAVLCGSRSPTTVKALQKLCTESRQSLRLILESQQKRAAYAPWRVELEAESHDAIERAAEALNIAYIKTPPSWLITEAGGSVAEYVDQLEWSSQPEVNWERQDFDPQRLGFLPARVGEPGTGARIRLSRYLNPVRLQWEHRLINDNRSASVNPEWGRYAVLTANRQAGLLYDRKSGSVAVPRGAPLPTLIARALALCSGYAPKFVPVRIIQSSILERYGFDVYAGVPPDVLASISRKLGQQEQVQPLSIKDESS